MAITATYVKDIVIQDPDTGGDVSMTVFKHLSGGLFALDASYLDQVAPEDCLGNPMVNDPLADLDDHDRLVLIYPDNEEVKN